MPFKKKSQTKLTFLSLILVVSIVLFSMQVYSIQIKKASDFIEFYMGILLIIAGVFFLLSKAVVRSSWVTFTVGGINVSTGLIVIPLMIGVAWLFYNPKSLGAKILSIVGTVIIIIAVISSIHISLMHMTLYDYVLIIGMIAAGIGMLLRYYFKKA